MIYSTGIDIVEIERIKAAMERFGHRFIDRIFTMQEIDYCTRRRHSAQHFAARFTAKEAVYKSLQIKEIAGMRWRDIEVVTDKNGIPSVRLYEALARVQQQQGISQIAISLTHSNNFAAAVAIAIHDNTPSL